MSENQSSGVPARRAALRLTDAVLRQGLPLEAALAHATAALDRAEDRALAHAIAATVLRRLPDLDRLIDGATAQALPPDAKARAALRLALAQALVLGTPPHAAIATVLPLVDGGPRRLVHGVFGHLMREGAALPDPPRLPGTVTRRWRRAWGEAMVAAAARAIESPPPIDLTLADPAATADWVDRLGGTSLMPGHVRLPAGAPIRDLNGYAEGAWWVQDIAASLPARLLGAGEGRGAVDLCAAPGGKTMQLIAAGWRVTAVDASERRITRLQDNLTRCHMAAQMIAADAGRWRPDAPAPAVLLDAPCSATGIFRRHPDVLHRVREGAISELAEQQRVLLHHALSMLAPGGRLVYAVCSLEPAEGEGVIADLPTGFAPDPIRAEELPEGLEPPAEGHLRILPHMLGGADGFFVARIHRIS